MKKNLIDDYIEGKEIDQISKIEDNKEFMIQVINTSNDFKMYNLCSNKLKNDYEFVKYLITKYQENTKFICKVADTYLLNSEDNINKLELTIIMNNIVENKEKQKYLEKLENEFRKELYEIQYLKLKNKQIEKEIELGFALIESKYKTSKIIINHYADKFIQEILYILFDEGTNLEQKIHEQFYCPEEIKKIGIKNYILNLIIAYDKSLAARLSINPELMDKLKKQIENILNNWDKYETLNKNEKYNRLFQKINKYLEYNKYNITLTKSEILYNIGIELNILEELNAYRQIDYKELKEKKLPFSIEEYVNKIRKSNFQDGLHYQNIKEIILEELNNTKKNIEYKEEKIYRKRKY